ncbi:HAD hydrolase-like protein [Devosia aurantiaca]|uniref:phosphoglycolate phosphatase n=1 Tax=Devosia aurantiaca TaxID=2714858 RepID=A0A6M1SVJ4_9HYPH|nr:HAD hydrolase-like protein [Devosia aurantiaca]NGP19105.1 HAD hydrolase-like protein [Devosia aurantiaca]
MFDLDGTLVHHVNPRVLQMLEVLDDCSHRAGRLVARFRLARRAATQPQKTPKLFVHKAIHKVRRKSVEQMLVPCETMRNVLERLRAEGVTLGVVSNGLGRGYGHDVLEAFGLSRYFSTAVFREDVSRGKPWPDSICAALSGIGRELRRNDVIWYIGDQRKDITAALAASAKLGRTIRPVALGPRAALGAVEARLSPSQIMWTPADFERAVRTTFGEDLRHWLIDPLPAPLL